MEKLSTAQRESNLSADNLSQRKYAHPKRKRRNDYARAASTQPYSDHSNQDESKVQNNTENNHAGAHLQVPAVTALSSHSAARTWIRSVSYPEQSGNTVVHFDNESEPLIKVEAAVMMCAELLSVWFCTFTLYLKYCCLFLCLLCL